MTLLVTTLCDSNILQCASDAFSRLSLDALVEWHLFLEENEKSCLLPSSFLYIIHHIDKYLKQDVHFSASVKSWEKKTKTKQNTAMISLLIQSHCSWFIPTVKVVLVDVLESSFQQSYCQYEWKCDGAETPPGTDWFGSRNVKHTAGLHGRLVLWTHTHVTGCCGASQISQ